MRNPLLTAGLVSVIACGLISASTSESSGDEATSRVDVRSLEVLATPPGLEGPGVSQAQGLRIVYVNFDGVTLTGSNSQDDGPTDQTAIPVLGNVIAPGQTITIPRFQPDQLGNSSGLGREAIIARVIEQLYTSHAPYDIEFVTERPASGDYSMVVVGGSCQTVAGMSGCGGIALLDCGDQIPNNITFVFPPGLLVDHIASVAGQEAAHAYGLSHTDDRNDIMFPSIQNTIPMIFGAGNVPDNPNCGNAFQDSNQMMLDTIGARGADSLAPTVTITSPADGSIVAGSSVVSATVTDQALANVEFLVAGAVISEASTGPFQFNLPESAAPGELTISVRATDDSGNVGSDSVTVTVSADGSEGNLGTPCVDGSTCDSGTCAELDGEQLCSRECSESAPCPAGFECRGGVACWPEDDGGCGCTSSGGPGGALASLLVLLGLVAIRRRR